MQEPINPNEPITSRISDQLYLLSSDLKQSFGWFERVEPIPKEVESSIARGTYTGTVPIRLKLVRRRKLPQVAWVPGYYPVVTAAIVQELTRSQVTGWIGYPVVVEGATVEMEPRFALGITGRCASIKAESHSANFEIRTDHGFPALYSKLLVDLDSWDGSDLFMGEDAVSLFNCATKKAVDVFSIIKHLGIRFRPLSDVWFLEGPAPELDGL